MTSAEPIEYSEPVKDVVASTFEAAAKLAGEGKYFPQLISFLQSEPKLEAAAAAAAANV